MANISIFERLEGVKIRFESIPEQLNDPAVMSDVKDEHFMRLALKEAKKGLGRTSPNPCVGAIIVKEGKIIARDLKGIYLEKALDELLK